MGEEVGIDGNFCVFGVTGLVPDGEDKYVFGNIFLENYYSIYDFQTD